MTTDAHFSHTLSFVGANGLGYTRTVYGDRLYVFSTHKGQLLTSMRYVPFNDLLFATYMALRATRDEEDDTPTLPSFVEETQSLQLRNDGVIPFAESALSLPQAIEQKAHDLIASTYQKVVADATFGGSLGAAPDLTRMDHALGERHATPTNSLSFATGLSSRDVGWVTMGHALFYEINQAAKDLHTRGDELLAVAGGDVEYEFSKRLYGDPRLLTVVKRVLRSKGGFVSPLVRHFVLFYLKWTKEQLQTRDQHSFWQQRLESTIGRAEAQSGGFLPYQAITLLGFVRHGTIAQSAEDPDRTKRRFQVEPTYPLDDVVLEEVTDNVLRAFLKGFVKVIYPYNTKQIQFVDELENEESLFEQLEREISGGE